MTSQKDIEYQADMLSKKTKHYLITTMGRVADEANLDEMFRALSYALREEIMINWLATEQTRQKMDSKTLHYLSLEYLPGRILSNNITNISAQEFVRKVLSKLGRDFKEIIHREHDPGLGNGGLGRLASCFLDSLATMDYPTMAYGLRYQYGIFEQQIWNGMQIEAPDCWLIEENPWEFRRDLKKVTVKYAGKMIGSKNIHGNEIENLIDPEEVWALPYDVPIIGYAESPRFSVATLRLWSTKESPRNFQLQSYNAGKLDQAAENTLLTDVLYPSDHHDVGKRIRLKQEFLLVSASTQDIIRRYLAFHDNFRQFADKVAIQINDTHPALIIAELIRIFTKRYDLPWERAKEITCQVTGYTNHTILKEALEVWDEDLMRFLLPRQLRVIERLNQDFCDSIRKQYPDDENKIQRMSIIESGRVKMANLAIAGSHKVNGVAKLHTEILKESVFKDFYEAFPEKFVNITNGVTPRRWLLHCNPLLADFVTERIGKEWITDFSHIEKLKAFADDPKAIKELSTIKQKNKARLVEMIKEDNKIRDSKGDFVEPAPLINVHSLFDIQAKRFHEYKRQLMNALHALMIYHDIKDASDGQRIARTIFFAGKAAAGYETAKEIILLISAIARKINRDTAIRDLLKVVMIENYNVSKAEIIIPGADLSEQISTAGLEASGTGNMKFAINGALTIGTDDGANIEMRQSVGDENWPFLFGASKEEIEQLKKESNYNPKEIYETHPKIKRAVDCLMDDSLAQNEHEKAAFSNLFHKLLEWNQGPFPDGYFVLYDLQAYYETQKKVEALYKEPAEWTRLCLMNIAGMGPFSSDVSIKNYAEKIWDIKPCPVDPAIEERVRYEYSLADQCRIY
ncbi:MAG: glycogen/starch/alpha-glucan phosphorylase [Chlamydiia bacterium]|nr:glycogen/starch/alpha-glucan phosphorylase [Chlamydiia bacterium]